MSDMIVKFISRLFFVLAVIFLVPLAVQNRQMVTLQLNPLALLNETQSIALSMPLFILVILISSIGLIGGALLGWGMARLQHHKQAGKLKRAVPPPPIPAYTKMLEDDAHAARQEDPPIDSMEKDGNS